MRIYNGTSASIELPLTSQQRLTVEPRKVSLDFLPNPEFLALLVSVFSSKEVAIVAGGPFELAMCSNLPVSAAYVVQSIDEAVQRFSDTTGEKVTEESLEKTIEEGLNEVKVVEETPVLEETTEDANPDGEFETSPEETEKDGLNLDEVVEEPVKKNKKKGSKKK